MKFQIIILLSAIICLPNQSQAQLFKKNKKKTEQTEDVDTKKKNSNYVYFEGFMGYKTEYSEATSIDEDAFDVADVACEVNPEIEDNRKIKNDQDLDSEDVIVTLDESYQIQPKVAMGVEFGSYDEPNLAYEASPEIEEYEQYENVQDVDIEDVITTAEESSLAQPEKKESALKRISNAIYNTLFTSEYSDSGTDGMSIAAMCCGIFGLTVFGFGILGVVFGAIGLRNTRLYGRRGQGMAIAGLVTGAVKVIIVVLRLALFI